RRSPRGSSKSCTSAWRRRSRCEAKLRAGAWPLSLSTRVDREREGLWASALDFPRVIATRVPPLPGGAGRPVQMARGRADMADLAQVTDQIRNKVGANAGLGKTIKLDFGDAGKIFIDGASTPNAVTNDDKAADCTISMSWDDFIALSEG